MMIIKVLTVELKLNRIEWGSYRRAKQKQKFQSQNPNMSNPIPVEVASIFITIIRLFPLLFLAFRVDKASV